MFKHKGAQTTGFLAKRKLFIAAMTLVGTIIGAGVLGIPYVLAKAGVVYGLLLIIAIGVAFLFLNLFAGEMVLRTKEQHQLTGYAEKYLGVTGKRFMTLSMLINIYGALIAYLIGEGATLQAIFGGQQWWFMAGFFVVTFVIVTWGVKATGKAEVILISLLIGIVLLIGVLSFPKIQGSYFTVFNLPYFFLPYGVVLFAFMGSPAIPEMQEELGDKKHLLKPAIIIGSLLPIAIYIIFTLVVVGVVGQVNFDLLGPNERIATVALSLYANPLLGTLANGLAVLAMFTSFLTLSLALVEMYTYDYHLPRWVGLGLTFSLPLLVVLLDFSEFITILGVTGAIAGGLDAILIVLMYWKAKILGDRKPEFTMGTHRVLGSVFIVMFALGIVYQLWQNFA